MRNATAASLSGRQLAIVSAASLVLLLLAVFLWFGAGFRAANDCKEGSYGLPVEATQMTEEGCQVMVAGEWSDPLPSRDPALALAATIAAALACVPPYALLVWRRRT